MIAIMPSPIGHVLAGVASGCAISGQKGWASLAIFGIAGVVADIDLLLPLQHRGPSHSIGAVTLVVAAAVALKARGSSRFALSIAAAYASHLLLDWLGEDTWIPYGIAALWPFSSAHYVSGIDLFDPVDRRYWLPGFWRGNAMPIFREIAILGPIAAVSMYRTLVRSSAPGAPPRRSV